MSHMNDFFGEPLFQPTGTDWIDHAFTAAVLDDIEREERARRSWEFAALTSRMTIDGDASVYDTETPIDTESEARVESWECIVYGKKYDLSPVFPFEPRHEHSEAVAMIERITGLSHGDAMKLEIRICQLGFIPLQYPDTI